MSDNTVYKIVSAALGGFFGIFGFIGVCLWVALSEDKKKTEGCILISFCFWMLWMLFYCAIKFNV